MIRNLGWAFQESLFPEEMGGDTWRATALFNLDNGYFPYHRPQLMTC
jgi:hypothetical protein